MAAQLSHDDGAEANGWQPVTFGGAAALARTTTGRVFLVGMVIASLMAGAVARTFHVAWMPVIEGAIKSLPARAGIVGGRLQWPTNAPVRLADNSFLALAVAGEGSSGLTEADLAIEFTENGWRATSLLGSLFIPYPPGLSISLDPVSLLAGWLAWRPHIVAGAFIVVIVFVWLVWLMVGLVVTPFLRVYTAMLQRAATAGDCLRLGIACCMPGEIVMAVGVLVYGLRRINLAELIAVAALHVIVVASYILITPLWLPRRESPEETTVFKGAASAKKNPFAAPPANDNDEHP
ncbi:MAG: hypothetical protein ACP5MD_09170 [Verrucomicrobiia bacterium]